MGGATKMVKNV